MVRHGRNRHRRNRNDRRPREATDPSPAIVHVATVRLSVAAGRSRRADVSLLRATRSPAIDARGEVAEVAHRHRRAALTTFAPGRPW